MAWSLRLESAPLLPTRAVEGVTIPSPLRCPQCRDAPWSVSAAATPFQRRNPVRGHQGPSDRAFSRPSRTLAHLSAPETPPRAVSALGGRSDMRRQDFEPAKDHADRRGRPAEGQLEPIPEAQVGPGPLPGGGGAGVRSQDQAAGGSAPASAPRGRAGFGGEVHGLEEMYGDGRERRHRAGYERKHVEPGGLRAGRTSRTGRGDKPG